MLKAYKEFWSHYFDFSGRTTRGSFWWAYIINVIIGLILLLAFILSTDIASALTMEFTDFSPLTYISLVLLVLWLLAIAIPTASLGIRRVRDTGLSPYLWLISPISIVLGEYDNSLLSILSNILWVAFLVITLLPSKKEEVKAGKQLRGVILASAGLALIVGFSVVNVPVKANQIVQTLPKTDVTIKTNMVASIDISFLSAKDKQDIIALYKTTGWTVSPDGQSLEMKVNPDKTAINVNGKDYQVNADGEVSTKLITNTKATISTSSMDGENKNIITSTNGTEKVKVSNNEQEITMNQTFDVKAAVTQMDNTNYSQYGISDGVYTEPVVKPLVYTKMSNNTMKAMSLPIGKKVNCNDFNGPKSNGIHYSDKNKNQFWVNFNGSDCAYIVINPFQYIQYCIRDHGNYPYCKNGNGACSAVQNMPRTYHKMNNQGKAVK